MRRFGQCTLLTQKLKKTILYGFGLNYIPDKEFEEEKEEKQKAAIKKLK